jgi:hypothetical protein
LEPTTGFEPVNPFLTKEVLYLLSYVGVLPMKSTKVIQIYVPEVLQPIEIIALLLMAARPRAEIGRSP